jgi:hypothetical protein
MDTVEPWVDADAVAKHVGCGADHIRKLARAKRIPATPMKCGKREFWKFKISLVDAAMIAAMNASMAEGPIAVNE